MQREIHTIDLTGEILGRVASRIAILLRGKNKPTFQPHLDQGAIVNLKNPEKLAFTGKKFEQKVYYRYSGYPGGITMERLKARIKNNPERLVRDVVYNMLPKNKLRDQMIKRLRFIK